MAATGTRPIVARLVAARGGGIDPAAPVHAKASIELPVEATVLWDVLADVANWPRFLPGVSRTRIATAPGAVSDRLGPASRFVWINGGIPGRSQGRDRQARP